MLRIVLSGHAHAVRNSLLAITLKMAEQGPAQKPYASDNCKPLNCMAQEFSTSGAHKQMSVGNLMVSCLHWPEREGFAPSVGIDNR
jgi:hypothetical protein